MPRVRKKALPDLTVREVGSDDGVVKFIMCRSRRGVYVTRVHSMQGGDVSHAANFAGTEEFARFCQGDDLRLVYPLVYVRLARDFDGLLGIDA